MKKNLILKVKSKKLLFDLEKFSTITYVSKFINTIGIQIDERNICKLKNDENIISYRESRIGNFEATTSLNCC